MRPKYVVRVLLTVDCTVFAVTPTGAKEEAMAICEEMCQAKGVPLVLTLVSEPLRLNPPQAGTEA